MERPGDKGGLAIRVFDNPFMSSMQIHKNWWVKKRQYFGMLL